VLALGVVGCFPQRELITGKGGGGGQDGSAAVPDSGQQGREELDSGAAAGERPVPTGLVPDEGPDSGGYTVEIQTSAGEAVEAVRFGETPVDIISRTGALVRVLVPALPVGAGSQSELLDVVIDDAMGSSTVPGGFRSFADATGQGHVLVHLSHLRWIDVAAARELGAEDELVARAWTVAPGELWPEEQAWSVEDGGCTGLASPASLLPGGGSVTLRLSDTRSFALDADGTGAFAGRWAYPAGGTELPGLTGQSFDVDLQTAVWPTGLLPGAAALPQDWSLDAPTLAEPALDLPQIDGFRVAWSGAVADRMAVHLRDLKGGAEVWCLVENTGEYVIPEEYTLGFASDWGTYEVELTVWAVGRNATTVQYNNGQVRVSGATGYRGRRTFFDLP
jgi:hypothetical protein